MRVIVSTTLKDNFKEFVVVDSLGAVIDLEGVTTVVIHTYKEEDFSAGVFISDLRTKGIDSFIYINSNPSKVLKLVLKGVNGHYYEDEFYLEDEEELLSLLQDLGCEVSDEESTGLVVTADSNLRIVSDFIESFSRGEARINSKFYLDQVSQAVTQLSEYTTSQNKQIVAMGTSAVDIFEMASTYIKSLNAQNEIIKDQLTKLEESNTGSQRPTLGNNITFFNPVSYTGISKVLFIREVSPCRYLTSFVLAYMHHLKYIRNKRVKLIFIHQKGQGVFAKYQFAVPVTQETQQLSNANQLFDADIIATNDPKKEVVKKLLSTKDDVYIVVDRLYGSQNILYGKIETLYAISGRSDLERFKLNSKECIAPIIDDNDFLFTIPTMKGYPVERDARLSAYAQMSASAFNLLDDRLEIE